MDETHARWKGGSATDRLFIIAVIVKGIDGVLGMAGGLLLHFADPRTLGWLIDILTMHELSRHPGNAIALAVTHFVEGLDVSKLAFASGYLFVHGAIKLFIFVMLLIGRHWSYPVGIAFLGIFVAYTGYRLSVHWSWFLLGFIVFDMVTIYLVAREWREQRRLWGTRAAAGAPAR
ncbi:MAG: DUF2127 domain-containing protein [Rhizobiales bacterium]|nr:DUF2127 domain-containing protein [Hyphomicrobiales bacterium]